MLEEIGLNIVHFGGVWVALNAANVAPLASEARPENQNSRRIPQKKLAHSSFFLPILVTCHRHNTSISNLAPPRSFDVCVCF